jgi:hypothetical protein
MKQRIDSLVSLFFFHLLFTFSLCVLHPLKDELTILSAVVDLSFVIRLPSANSLDVLYLSTLLVSMVGLFAFMIDRVVLFKTSPLSLVVAATCQERYISAICQVYLRLFIPLLHITMLNVGVVVQLESSLPRIH